MLLRLRAEWVWEDGTLDPILVETLQPPEWMQKYDAESGATSPCRWTSSKWVSRMV